jgi:hypothetical protein
MTQKQGVVITIENFENAYASSFRYKIKSGGVERVNYLLSL